VHLVLLRLQFVHNHKPDEKEILVTATQYKGTVRDGLEKELYSKTGEIGPDTPLYVKSIGHYTQGELREEEIYEAPPQISKGL